MIKTLKEIKVEELNEIMDIWLDSNREAHYFIKSEYWENNYSFVKKEIVKAHIKIHKYDTNIAGFIGITEQYIAGMFVKKEYRNKGIGKQLLDSVKGEWGELYLSVYKNNLDAVRFYLSQGFNIIEETCDEETDQEEYRMVWKK